MRSARNPVSYSLTRINASMLSCSDVKLVVFLCRVSVAVCVQPYTQQAYIICLKALYEKATEIQHGPSHHHLPSPLNHTCSHLSLSLSLTFALLLYFFFYPKYFLGRTNSQTRTRIFCITFLKMT